MTLICHLPFAIRHSPFAIRHLLFAICHSPFAIRHSPFAIRHSPFAICHSPFAIRHSPSAIRYSLFAIRHLLPLLSFLNMAIDVPAHSGQDRDGDGDVERPHGRTQRFPVATEHVATPGQQRAPDE